jgi:hypothetical protein
MGTSTSGVLQTERAYQRRDPQTGKLPGEYHYGTTRTLFRLAHLCGSTAIFRALLRSSRRHAPRVRSSSAAQRG